MEVESLHRVGPTSQGEVSAGLTKTCLSQEDPGHDVKGRGAAGSWEPGMPLNGNFGSAGI